MDQIILPQCLPMEDLAAARSHYLEGEESPAGVRPQVLESWGRSRAYGVDPTHMQVQEPDEQSLAVARERSRRLLAAAEPLLAVAHRSIPDQPHLLALADADGTILRMFTGPGLPEDEFVQANLFEGASWHERDIGCNGVGTSLATGEPIILIGPEHFQQSYVGWTCVGVPIRRGGEIVGALDMSVPNEHVHIHTWGWVLSLAAAMESNLAQEPHPAATIEPQVAPDLKGPFSAIRGVFDLLARQLDVPHTHAAFIEEARAEVDRAESLLNASVSQLRQNNERLRRIAESGMVGVLFWDLDGRILYSNRQFQEMVGYSPQEMEAGAVNWRSLTPPEWQSVDDVAVEELQQRGVTRPFEKEYFRKDGTRVPVLLSAARFSDSPTRGVTLVLDMSERKAAEREIRVAYEEAQRALQERDQVLALVSHDLRNPLHSITMANSLLLEDIGEDRKRGQVGIIRRASDQMLRLIDDLLDVSRIQGGGIGILPEPQPAADLARSALDFLAPMAESRGVHLHLDLQTERVVAADRQRVLQVFTNLVSNALNHTSESGSIVLRARDDAEGGVLFSIEDSGSGIAPADLPQVFDRFWQAKRTGRAGAGLGLAIAKGIIDAHGGRIWAESVLGTGSTFYFTLPRAADTRSKG